MFEASDRYVGIVEEFAERQALHEERWLSHDHMHVDSRNANTRPPQLTGKEKADAQRRYRSKLAKDPVRLLNRRALKKAENERYRKRKAA